MFRWQIIMTQTTALFSEREAKAIFLLNLTLSRINIDQCFTRNHTKFKMFPKFDFVFFDFSNNLCWPFRSDSVLRILLLRNVNYASIFCSNEGCKPGGLSIGIVLNTPTPHILHGSDASGVSDFGRVLSNVCWQLFVLHLWCQVKVVSSKLFSMFLNQ